MSNVYELNADLFYEIPQGEPVTLWYLPTERSRKWRRASVFVKSYNWSEHNKLAQQLKAQNGWFDYQWRSQNEW